MIDSISELREKKKLDKNLHFFRPETLVVASSI